MVRCNCLIYALIGALVMLFILIVIGITQPRRTSIMNWCFLYLAIAVIFDGLVVVALAYEHAELIQLLLGGSAGAATGLGIHVTHHIFEERESAKMATAKNK